MRKTFFVRLFIGFLLSIFVFSSCFASLEVKSNKKNTQIKIKTETKKKK
ncbi:MAG TPA: hypothetical protein PK351_12470 [Spirochaetota bacterium]|nr:hypothetical protein [Spirochaetota bacterium]